MSESASSESSLSVRRRTSGCSCAGSGIGDDALLRPRTSFRVFLAGVSKILICLGGDFLMCCVELHFSWIVLAGFLACCLLSLIVGFGAAFDVVFGAGVICSSSSEPVRSIRLLVGSFFDSLKSKR